MDGAVIKEGKELGYADANNSELRNNIQRNKDMSYYYAHSTETPLPDSLRFVSGGDPIPLSSPGVALDASASLSSAKEGEKSPEVKKQDKPWRKITKYSWCDSEEWVKIYITQDEIMKIVKEHTDKKNEHPCIDVKYTEESLEFRVFEYVGTTDEIKSQHQLVLKNLANNIEPDNCKPHKVSGSKVTLTLAKVNKSTKWFNLGS